MKALLILGAIVLIALALSGPVWADSSNIFGVYFWGWGASGLMNGHQGYDVELNWPGIQGVTDWSQLRTTLQNARNAGFTPIVRLDWNCGTAQVVPMPDDPTDRQTYSTQCKACVQAVGDLCNIWMIGNEMNLSNSGEIPADWYLSCFNGTNGGDPVYNCYTQIHSVQSNAIVIMGPVAPWNADTNATGPYNNTYEKWKNYWYFLVNNCGTNVDGWAVHAYGGRLKGQPGSSSNDSDARDDCNAPYTLSTATVDVCWDFNAFRYFADEVATAQGDLNRPIYITETNCACDTAPSTSYKAGWMQSAYEAVDTYNKNHYQKIRCLDWFVFDTAGSWTTYALCCGTGNMTQAAADYSSMTSTENYQWTSNTPDAYVYSINTGSSNASSSDPNQIVLGSYVGKYENWQGADVNWAATAPSITTQPVAQTVCSGTSATFTVAASGNPAPTYQWRLNGSDISGATGTSLTTGVAGSYDCVATNSLGSATSNSVALTVNAAPSITTQPIAATVCSPNTNTFTVAASGTPTPTYQWRLGGTNIAGATSSSYTTGVAGNYDCVITNSCGSATSNSVALTVNAAPSITTQPQAATVCSPNTNMFTVAASGTPTPTCQWRLGGTNIAGATSSSYTTGVAGSYDCVLTNSCGAATSNSVSLTVNSAPSITTQPQAAAICSGNTNTFTAAASGTPTPTYQWQLGGANIPGATSSSYTTGVVGSYDCVMTNSCGSATSNSVALTLNSAPSITTQPIAHTVCSGNTAVFSVVASATPAPTYQWQLSGNNISGATSSSYTTSVAGSYACVITNSCGHATSDSVALTVNTPPTIATQPQAATVCSGNTNTFTVAAYGSSPSYQWRLNGSNITGATSSSYATAVAGNYDCVVTNSCGSATTSSVALTLSSAPSITTQPQAATVSSPNTNTFTIAASGTAPLSYQWRLYGSSISGATATSYTTGVAGSYDCVVTNSCGVVSSNAATLTINGGTPVATVAAAKAFSDGTLLTISSGPVVTWSFDSFFYYVEDVNRTTGIRVIPSGSSVLAQGSIATIIGTIETLAGERVIQSAVASDISSGTVPSPLGMNCNSANLTLAQGLWVRLWGVATVPQGATDTFTLSDGSDHSVRVKLYGIGLPDDQSFVNVIGVLGQDAGGPVLRVNSSSCIW